MRKVPELRFDGFDGEWEEKKLSNIVKINSGRDYKHLSEGKYPVYGTGGLMTYVSEFLSDVDSVGIGRKGTINKPQKLEAPFWTVDTLFYATPIKDYNLDYIYSVFQIINWLKYDESTGLPSLSKTNINNIRIYNAGVQEQEKIGNLFKKIDDLIEIQEGKVAKLEDFKKSMLQKMFPKKGKLVPEFRFDGFDNYGFDKGKINDFIVTHGSKNYIKQPEDVGTYKVIQQGDIPIAGYSNEEPYKDFSNVILFGDHTLSLFKPYEPFLLSTDGIKIMFIENIDREYFYYLVQHVMPKSQGYKRHYKILRAVKVNIPKSYKEQEKIGQFFKNLDSQIENEEKLLDSYKMMKKSLLQKMFV